MSMKEFLEAGYKVIFSSMYGDLEIETAEEAECYEEESKLTEVDEEKKIAYYYDTADYDD